MAFKRVLIPMFVMGIILGLSSMSFAQINGAGETVACSISVLTAGTLATATGHTEPIGSGPTGIVAAGGAGGVHIACETPAVGAPGGSAGGTAGVGVLSVNLGVPITNTNAFPTELALPTGNNGIRATNGTGVFTAAGTSITNVGIAAVNNSTGQIVIGLGSPAATNATTPVVPTTGITFPAGASCPVGCANLSNSFDLIGILVSLNGQNKSTVSATLTMTPGAGYVPGAVTSVQVIDAVSAGLKDPTLPVGSLPATVSAVYAAGAGLPVGTVVNGGPAVLTTNGAAVKGTFTIRIEENYASMLKSNTQFNGGATFPAANSADTEVSVLFSNIPTGLTLSNCSVTSTDSAGGATLAGGNTDGLPTLSSPSVTSTSPVLTVNFNGAIDQAVVNVLWITCGVNVGTATGLSSNITAQAFLSPTGAALSSTSTALTGLTTGQIPRYQQLLQPATPLAVVVFPPATTTMLIPFTTFSTGYNTGIAVSNTTADSFAAGLGAAPQEGPITFTLYSTNSDGTNTVKTYTTSTNTVGSGLTATGVLKSGSTYSVNLSEIVAKAFGTTTTAFQGYVFITTAFTNAHGAATVYVNATGSAIDSPTMLYVPTPNSTLPRSTTESLGF